MTEQKQIEEIKALFQKHEIRRVKLGGTDLDGVLRGKFISLDKFWSVVEGGMGFCDVVLKSSDSGSLFGTVGVRYKCVQRRSTHRTALQYRAGILH